LDKNYLNPKARTLMFMFGRFTHISSGIHEKTFREIDSAIYQKLWVLQNRVAIRLLFQIL